MKEILMTFIGIVIGAIIISNVAMPFATAPNYQMVVVNETANATNNTCETLDYSEIISSTFVVKNLTGDLTLNTNNYTMYPDNGSICWGGAVAGNDLNQSAVGLNGTVYCSYTVEAQKDDWSVGAQAMWLVVELAVILSFVMFVFSRL